MRILVISRQKFPIPMEQMPVLIQAFADWRARYRPVLEAFEFFAGGGGGFGIANIADEAALNQMLLEYPLGPSNELEVRPVIDGDVALAQWLATMQAMAGGAGPR